MSPAPSSERRTGDLDDARAAAETILATMTLPEKAGQVAQVEKDSITPDEVATFAIGSVLSGCGGNPEPNDAIHWRHMVEAYLAGAERSRLGIPLLYGTDSVHGHGNVVGATIFPHNIGLGAAADPDLVERVYRATAVETAATGARWTFAPTVAVALDPRWGRTYESFGDDPDLVTVLGAAAVRGLQGPSPVGSSSAGQSLSAGDTTLACLKHYVGDGGTEWGSADDTRAAWIDWWDGWGDAWSIDQGDARIDESALRRIHLAPYRAGIEAGALSVMASYSSWNGDKLHGHHHLLTDVLKGELGFDGFVVSDWLGIAQLDPDPYRCAVLAIGAGIDLVMLPFDFRSFIADVVRAVEVGDLNSDRLDDAVRRILTVKHAMGLFDGDGDGGRHGGSGGDARGSGGSGTGPCPLPRVEVVGSVDHRALAREAVAASAVLLRNEGGTLPITGGSLLVAGPGADDIGLQCGAWTIEWQGGTGPITPGTTIVAALGDVPELSIQFDVDARFVPGVTAPIGVAVVAEPPHAEGQGDRTDLTLPSGDAELVRRLRERVERLVLVVVSGRPLLLDEVIDHCDAVVAAWLPGTEGSGIADVLTGARPFSARLPRPWPGRGIEPTNPMEANR